MNHLLENFDLVATAPEGIAQLRKLILELAIRGKLVPQDPADESAHILVDRIKNERARLIKKGNIRRDKELPKINPEEEPFLLPSSWKWVRYSDLATFLNGRAYRKDELLTEGTPVLRVGNLFTSEKWYYSNLQLESEKYCEQGDLLYAWSASFGPHIWNGEKCIYHYHIWKVVRYSDGLINRDYLYLCLLEDTERIKKSGHGVMLAHMTKEAIEKRVMPFPPLAEQTRIVTRVQELMAVLDRLEEQTKDAEKSREQTLLATTRALPQSPTPGALAHGWGRFSENLDHLVRRAEDVKAFRSMVLELAVRGKLVPQDNTTEPASVLLEGIKAEKSRLASSGRIKAGKQLQTISDEEKPFKEPKGWIWARLGDLSPYGLFDGDWIESKDQDPEGKIKLIQLADILENRYLEKSNRYINDSTFQQLKCSEVLKNDILIARLPNPIGRACVFPGSIRKCITAVDIAILRSSPFINQHALALFINSPLVKEQILTYGKGATRFRIATGDLKNVMVPVPPLSLQAAIVARVQELMAVLDRLEDHLRGKEMVGSKYSETIVSLG